MKVFPIPEADLVDLNSAKEAEIDTLILAAAGMKQRQTSFGTGPSARIIRNRKSSSSSSSTNLRRSVSMKAATLEKMQNNQGRIA